MTRPTAWFVHVAVLLVAGTGLAYGWMRYFVESDDEFAVVNHPWQPAMQHLHVLFAPLLVFACGMIWLDHVWKRVRSGFPVRRRSGLLLAALVFVMIASGYLLQVSTDDAWRTAWIWVHVASSLGWTGGYAVHQLAPRRKAERARAGREAGG
ncbi:MAG TPA: hypothetical protein VK081_05995 [Planctomycetota bacterium]|nr:hypothetical protein [Planctomycetota bacterium]